MTDPAVEACARVARTTATGIIYPGCPYAAAREALAPIRRDHYPVAYTNRRQCCVRCFDEQGRPHIWPCNPAQHAYTSEELK